MTAFSREQLLELAPLFAIGATTPEETSAVEAALRADPELAAEVSAFRDAATVMATATPVAPSSALKAQLMAAVASSPTAAGGRATGASQRPILTSEAPRRPAWQPIALAASLLVAVGLGANTFRLRGELDRVRASVAALDTQLQSRERTLNTLLEAERDLHVVYLQSEAGAAGPGMQFFWNTKQGSAVAHVFRLNSAPDGRDYQIWALVDGKPVSLSVFNSDADGRALVERFTLPASTAGVSAVLVSLEPKGGSVQPTTTPFLAGNFIGG